MITVKQHINKFKITVIIMSIIDDAIDYVKKIFYEKVLQRNCDVMVSYSKRAKMELEKYSKEEQ